MTTMAKNLNLIMRKLFFPFLILMMIGAAVVVFTQNLFGLLFCVPFAVVFVWVLYDELRGRTISLAPVRGESGKEFAERHPGQ